MCYNLVTNQMERMIVMRKFLRYGICAVLGAAVLTGCTARADGAATLPMSEGTKPVFTAREETAVTSGGELAAAIVPGAVVQLGELELDMTQGVLEDTPYCRWESLADGVQLIVSNVENLTIRGVDSEKTSLENPGSSAAVLLFENCGNITLENLRVSHSNVEEQSSGYGLYFRACGNVTVRGVNFDGKNFIGLVADDVQKLLLDNTVIQGAASEGLSVYNCGDVKLNNCRISGIGQETEDPELYSGYTALYAAGSTKAVLEKCTVEDNCIESIAVAQGAQVMLRECTVRNNRLDDCGFITEDEFSVEEGQPGAEGAVILKDCVGDSNRGKLWMTQVGVARVTDETGRGLLEVEVCHMLGELQKTVAPPTVSQEEKTVTSLEEFLDAIGSNRKIIVDTALLDQSKADTGKDGTNYSWEEVFDGRQLVIHDVDNLTICGKAGRNSNVISAAPRYAQVLTFRNCTNVSVENLTVGHTKEPGYCIGGVLWFESCVNVQVTKCGLYGCGTVGVQAYDSRNVHIKDNEIYECSYGGVLLSNVATAAMEGNTFRDLGDEYGGYVYQVFSDCSEITFDGKRVTPGTEQAYVK